MVALDLTSRIFIPTYTSAFLGQLWPFSKSPRHDSQAEDLSFMDRTAWTIEWEYMGVLELQPVWECSFRAVLPNSNPAENNCTLVTYLILACKAGH